MMHSPDGGNSCTGRPANFDASNVGTTNEHAKQGNERHTMAEQTIKPPRPGTLVSIGLLQYIVLKNEVSSHFEGVKITLKTVTLKELEDYTL
jgi:hypothetical protein